MRFSSVVPVDRLRVWMLDDAHEPQPTEYCAVNFSLMLFKLRVGVAASAAFKLTLHDQQQ